MHASEAKQGNDTTQTTENQNLAIHFFSKKFITNQWI